MNEDQIMHLVLCCITSLHLNDRPDADDLKQAGFLDALKAIRTAESKGVWIAQRYVYKAAWSGIRNAVRKELKHENNREPELLNEASFADEQNATDAQIDSLQLLEQCTEKQRAAITLVYLEQMSPTAAADQLGISYKSLNYRINAGFKRIRKDRQKVETLNSTCKSDDWLDAA